MPLPQTLPGAGRAETPPETLKLLTISWGQKRQGRERVFINLALATEPSGTWEGSSFPTRREIKEEKHQHIPSLGTRQKPQQAHPSPLLNLEHSAKPVLQLTWHLSPWLDQDVLLRARDTDGGRIPTHTVSICVPSTRVPGPPWLYHSHLRQHLAIGRDLKSEMGVQMLELAADSNQPNILDKGLKLLRRNDLICSVTEASTSNFISLSLSREEQDLQGNLPVHKPQFLYLSEREIAPQKNSVRIESNSKERVPNTGAYGEPPNHVAEPICEVEPASSFNESLSSCFFFFY